MTIVTVLTLRLAPSRTPDVVSYYQSARILESSGASIARLCVSTEDSGTVIVIAEWPDRGAYETWQASPVRGAFSQGILEAAGGAVSSTSEVFQVAEA